MTELDPITASRYTTDKIHLPSATFGQVSAKTREKAAERGEAMRDGSFPIRDKKDLQRAIQAYGRAKDKAAAKRHIIRRARALDQVELLPNSWKELATREFAHEPRQEDEALTAASKNSLAAKIARHNAVASEDAQVCEAQVRVVYKRGLNDYSSCSALGPEQAAQARVNAFLRLLRNGQPDSPQYTQDNDLLPAGMIAAGFSASPPFS